MERAKRFELSSVILCKSDICGDGSESIGRDYTQPCQGQEVASAAYHGVQTESSVCPTCGSLVPTTKITQALHKNNTSVCPNALQIDDEIPHAVLEGISKWSKLPQPMKDGIKAMLEGIFAAL